MDILNIDQNKILESVSIPQSKVPSIDSNNNKSRLQGSQSSQSNFIY